MDSWSKFKTDPLSSKKINVWFCVNNKSGWYWSKLVILENLYLEILSNEPLNDTVPLLFVKLFIKEFYQQIINLKTSNRDIIIEAKKRLQSEYSE